ncbi:MAG: ABC transporter permease [Vicinamibacterales bacterium]
MMTDWQTRVRRHLRERGTVLPDAVVEELADHLEDAWAARPDPQLATDPDAFAAEALRRADMMALAHRPPAPPLPPVPEPGRGSAWFSGLGGEVRHTLRLLARAPGFAVAVVAVLALGIGATTAAFQLVHSALLAPLPYPDADRLALVWEHNLPRGRARNVINSGNYYAWSERSTSLDMSGLFAPRTGNLSGDGGVPEELRGVVVEPQVLAMLGARPLAGRLFVAGDATPGAAPVVLIAEGLWRRRYGGAADAVGRAVVMNGEPTTIIGVLPADFTVVGFRGEFWRPAVLSAEARTSFRGRSLMSLVKLRPGIARDAAQQELAAVFAGLVEEHPEFNTGWTLNVVPLREQLASETRPALWVLFGAVVAVLLIACANVAALLLVRATGRRHELAVKVSLGARPMHLARQLFLETALLVGAGGVLGALVAALLTRVVSTTARDAGVPLVADGSLGAAALAFAVVATAVTALSCGLGPALGARRVSVHDALREGGRGGVGSRQRLRGWLVAGEVAAATLILSGAALLGRSYVALQDVDPGFNPQQVLTARVSRMGAAASASEVPFATAVLDRLRSLPGVTGAAATSFLPLDGNPGIGSSFMLADRPEPPPGERPVADYRPVTPGYFATLQIPLRQGRDFTAADIDGRPKVAIVNESFVRLLSADVSPLGRRLADSLGETQEIVGVVGDVTLASLDAEQRPTIYLPFAQLPVGALTFVVRTAAGEPDALGRAVAAAIRDVDPNQPVSDIRPLDEVVARSLIRPRVASAALGLFAAAALLLAAIGVYGVVAYGVSQRRAEFGVRLALGAQPGDVVRLVLRQSLVMVLGGVVAGAALAVPLSSTLRSLLFGVGPGDPVTLAAVAALLVGAGVLASYLPARRGTQVDPVSALRAE